MFSEALSVENLATFFSNKRLCLLIVVNMESWRVSGRIGVMLFLSKVLAVYFEGACPHFWSCFLFSRVFVSPIPGISGRRQAPGMGKSFRAQTLHPVDPLETSKLKSSKQTLSHKSILIYLIYFEGHTSKCFLKLRSNWHTGWQNWAKFDSDISYHGFFTTSFVYQSEFVHPNLFSSSKTFLHQPFPSLPYCHRLYFS